MSALSPKQLARARAVYDQGVKMGISPRGITIALATVFVESNWVMYANRRDPGSLSFPHEALSYDGRSSGLFQQQPPWWGTAAQRMDPAASAQMFYAALQKLNYNNPKTSPGWYAQAVQKSAFPGRYDANMGRAQALYRELASAPPRSFKDRVRSVARKVRLPWTRQP